MNFYELNEATSRYSVEVNYRTTTEEVKEGFAKLLLSFVSAAMKERSYHVKKVMDEKPLRIIISAKNWQDGEWVLLISFNPDEDCFVLSKGFYNKDRDTVTVQSSEKCVGHSAAEIFRNLHAKMEKVKNEKPHHIGDLKGGKGKPGPQKGSMRHAQSYLNLSKFLSPSSEDKVGM